MFNTSFSSLHGIRSNTALSNISVSLPWEQVPLGRVREARKGWKGGTGTEGLPSYLIRCGGFAFSSMKGFMLEKLPTQSWISTAAQPQAFCSEATRVMAPTYQAPGRQTVTSRLDAGD